MIRTDILKACEARDSALFDVALLAERLSRTPRGQGALEGEALYASLRARLPEGPNRLLAFGLALRTATADSGHPGAAELPLAQLSRELGLTPAQVRDMRRGLADGVSPLVLAAEPASLLHARVLEAVLLTAGLEVRLTEAEVTALGRAQEDMAHLRELAGQLLCRNAFGAQAAWPLDSLRQQLTALALAPSTLVHRQEAWRLAVRFSHAIGQDLAQQLVLDLMRELLHVDAMECPRPTAPASSRT
ncbi:hypothetical protein [Corallococcus aberystwythensis]|uniref:Uncharacterized protein n=1 Tax=Corallococcus aberystwythensis TaxID=2316722 RepID=A0A3A8PPQ3_9BACT|nr:hypothetical protein [Corallococcus aberystwythensis]RKH58098.1 hypothetical protein D7W81_29715 [Corallococcus aberystwythensis]